MAKTKQDNSPKIPKKTGRPSDYTDEIGTTICTQLAEGKSLVTICKSDEMPHISTVYYWLSSYSEFSDKYRTARDQQADTIADEVLKIPDELFENKLTMSAAQLKSEVELARLRVDARRWHAGKLKPKKYGEKPSDENDKNPNDEQLSESERIAKAMGIFDAARARADSKTRKGD